MVATVRIPTIRLFISSGCIIPPREQRDLRQNRSETNYCLHTLIPYGLTSLARPQQQNSRCGTRRFCQRAARRGAVHQRTSPEISNLPPPLALFSPEATLAERAEGYGGGREAGTNLEIGATWRVASSEVCQRRHFVRHCSRRH